MSSIIDKVQGNSISTHAEQVIEQVLSEEEVVILNYFAYLKKQAQETQRNRENAESRQRYYNMRDHMKAKYFSK